VEWMVADDKVCEKWMSLASRLSLSHFSPAIVSANSRRQFQNERSKLKMLLQVWKEQRPESYNLKVLKTVLAQEGLHEMVMWINLMTQESPKKEEVADLLKRKLSTPSPLKTPPKQNSREQATTDFSLTSPWSSYLYTPQTSTPYSAFFNTSPGLRSSDSHDYSSNASMSIDCFSDSSTPDISSPTSRLSDIRFINNHQTHPDISVIYPDTPSLTSPGRIIPVTISSPQFRSPTIARPGNGKVFSVLYRPDLIKLSSVKNRKKSSDSEQLHPVMYEEGMLDWSRPDTSMRDERNIESFKSLANIELIKSPQLKLSSKNSVDETYLDAKHLNTNRITPMQTICNKGGHQSPILDVFHSDSKENSDGDKLSEADDYLLDKDIFQTKSDSKDDFFDYLLNVIEESVKDI